MGEAGVWHDRFETLGHTGWRNPVIYAYDQLERLRIVDAILSEAELRGPGVAIDFGCGTGDFSSLLIGRGFEVYAYDPHVAPLSKHERLHATRDLDDLSARVLNADLALSVTVLDHIVDDAQLAATLAAIRACLSGNARFLLIEYALDDDAPGFEADAFQAFRTLGTWRKKLAEAGFELVESCPVPHPNWSPSTGYRSYRRSFGLRVLRLLRAVRTGPGQRMLAALARRALDRYPPELPHPQPSPMKCLLARTTS